MKKVFLILSICLLALTGCSKSVEVKLASEVTVWVSDDRSQKINLTANDSAYVELNTWLNEHSSGWYTTSGRFPGGVYIKSGEQGIQVTKTRVVIYSTKSGKPQAIYVQDLTTGELAQVRNLGQ